MKQERARTVLVVEDADICSATLEIALDSLAGISVRCFHAAEEAVRWLESEDACAVITDLDLPGMSGFELIEYVRRQPRYSRLPLVVISGDGDPRTPARVLAMGADAFFAKPYSPAGVRQKLEQLIDAA
ncbi:MAG: response regulator [Acidobacteria bacterium]|nr:response regulator [Acidobacteriota bacterium]